ncbi:cytochrome P450 [Massilia sp. IC2-477]|uniref:cytochrome P450 n=1 Tax=Massilia sp. IC2-477 TaxID=2887198 RepID=UPI001D0FA7D3|nr:cytochrome P450 [Massilia sp. IC2-477]MCC2956516.1 cytochrome P450 [Massilia sp. IC2-477]
MDKPRKDTFLLAAGVLGAFGAGLAAGRSIARAAGPGTTNDGLPRASLLDTLALGLEVFAPLVAQGVIIRRPPMVALAERLDLDRRAVQRMQKLRDKYGRGPLMLPLPIRQQAVVLDPGHAKRVLDESPKPFSPASTEKRAALAHFEPQGVLLSTGAQRSERRRFNEAALDTANPMHRMAAGFLPLVEEEAAAMLAAARDKGSLDWDTWSQAWYRMFRRVVLGNSAADDHALQAMITRLRGAANWAGFHPTMRAKRERFLARIQEYLDRAEAGSLAGYMAHIPRNSTTEPRQQVPQWLFAFDAAVIASFRALALLDSHPEAAGRVRAEIAGRREQHPLPFLRATVLEALRLWPTTPMILRQSTARTHWEDGSMPAGTGVLIHAPFFHRDDTRLREANRFAPELWLDDSAARDWPLVPFSDGPVTCPGRNLVLMLSSAMLANVLDGRKLALAPGRRLDPARLPGTLDNYRLRFTVEE